jgi:hypothetical protein
MKTYNLVILSLFFQLSKGSRKIKDTLFLIMIVSNKNTCWNPTSFYLDDSSGGSNGSFFFKEIRGLK